MSASIARLRSLGGRFLIALVVGSMLMVGAVAGVNEEIGKKIDNIPKIDLVTAAERPGAANYLLVGSDTRKFTSDGAERDALEREAFGDASAEAGQNSDTIMVVHVEPKAERTFVLSFPRDLLVSIPGHGYGKINSAYGYPDGEQLLIQTLKNNFDIEIQHFLELDFKTFVGLVNELGTVPMYVPYAARDESTGLDIPNPGCVALDGETGLQWARSRSLQYLNTTTGQWIFQDQNFPDIRRIERQQDFMRRLAGLAVQKSLANPFTAYIVADKVTAGLKADDAFDRGSVNSLIDAFRTLNPQDQSALEFATLPWKGGPDYNRQSVLYVNNDDPATAEFLQRLRTFEDPPKPSPAPSSIRVRVVNASGRPELAVAVSNTLKELGFQTVEPVESTKKKDQIDGVDVRVSLDNGAKGNLVSRYISPTAQVTAVPPSDVDVTLVLGRAFQAIVQPADALAVTDTTVAAAPVESTPEAAATPPVVEVPAPVPAFALPASIAPPASLAAQVPPAPRGNC